MNEMQLTIQSNHSLNFSLDNMLIYFEIIKFDGHVPTMMLIPDTPKDIVKQHMSFWIFRLEIGVSGWGRKAGRTDTGNIERRREGCDVRPYAWWVIQVDEAGSQHP